MADDLPPGLEAYKGEEPAAPTFFMKELFSPVFLAVLDAMRTDWATDSDAMASACNCTREEVLAVCRALRAMGLAEYGSLYSDDDTTVRGRGYWLNKKGVAFRNTMNSEHQW